MTQRIAAVPAGRAHVGSWVLLAPVRDGAAPAALHLGGGSGLYPNPASPPATVPASPGTDLTTTFTCRSSNLLGAFGEKS